MGRLHPTQSVVVWKQQWGGSKADRTGVVASHSHIKLWVGLFLDRWERLASGYNGRVFNVRQAEHDTKRSPTQSLPFTPLRLRQHYSHLPTVATNDTCNCEIRSQGINTIRSLLLHPPQLVALGFPLFASSALPLKGMPVPLAQLETENSTTTLSLAVPVHRLLNLGLSSPNQGLKDAWRMIEPWLVNDRGEVHSRRASTNELCVI